MSSSTKQYSFEDIFYADDNFINSWLSANNIANKDYYTDRLNVTNLISNANLLNSEDSKYIDGSYIFDDLYLLTDQELINYIGNNRDYMYIRPGIKRFELIRKYLRISDKTLDDMSIFVNVADELNMYSDPNYDLPNDIDLIYSETVSIVKFKYPQDIDQFQSLIELYLSDIVYTSKLGESLRNLPKLEYLIYNDSNLLEIPSDILSLTNLKNLDLSSNQIKYLPLEFCKLTKLQTLSIDVNVLVPPLLKYCNNISVLTNFNSKIMPSGLYHKLLEQLGFDIQNYIPYLKLQYRKELQNLIGELYLIYKQLGQNIPPEIIYLNILAYFKNMV